MLAIDPLAANVIGYNAGLSIDTIASNAINAGTNVTYAGAATSRATASWQAERAGLVSERDDAITKGLGWQQQCEAERAAVAEVYALLMDPLKDKTLLDAAKRLTREAERHRLTPERLAAALRLCEVDLDALDGDLPGDLLAALGPVVVPGAARAAELAEAINNAMPRWTAWDDDDGHDLGPAWRAGFTAAVRSALATLQPPRPASDATNRLIIRARPKVRLSRASLKRK